MFLSLPRFMKLKTGPRSGKKSALGLVALFALPLLLPPAPTDAQTPSATTRAKGGTEAPGNSAELNTRLEKAIKDLDAQRMELHVPGAALVVVKDDKIVAIRGLGVRDVEEKLPVTPRTLFAIGSSTKAFTAMSVLMTAEAGKLKLTDPPRKYLPYFKLRDADADSKITISDLLCHRSGLERTDLAWYTGKLRSKEIIRVACEAKPTAKLGEKFQYQNVMFLAAGEAVGAAQRQPWTSFVTRRILRPLGMKATTFSVDEMQSREDFAHGYAYDRAKNETELLPIRDIRAIAPAGAINSNAEDMAQWLRLMLNNGVFQGKRLLSQASMDQITSKHMDVAGPVSYGYGWFLRDWHGHKVVEHGGNIDGFSAEVALMPDQKLGFVLLTNLNVTPLQPLSLDIVFNDLVDVPKSAVSPDSGTPVASNAPVGDPKQEVGVYPLAPTLELDIFLRDGALWVHPTNQPEFPLKNLGGRKYTLAPPAPPGILLTFQSSKADPKRNELHFEQGGVKLDVLAKPVSNFVAPITVAELFAKAIQAAGGEANLRKRKSQQARFALEMPTQGITGEAITYSRAPYCDAQLVTLRAAGKKIATIRTYFDGKQGGSESSLSKGDALPESMLAQERVNADFYRLLNWKTAFKTVIIKAIEKATEKDKIEKDKIEKDKIEKDKSGDDEVYVVEESLEKGAPIVERYSTKSFLLLQRDRKIQTPGSDTPISTIEKFSDYRLVDGVMVPYKRVQSQNGQNETILQIKEVRFDPRLSNSLFRPTAQEEQQDGKEERK